MIDPFSFFAGLTVGVIGVLGTIIIVVKSDE